MRDTVFLTVSCICRLIGKSAGSIKKHKDSKLLENEHSIEGGISLDKVVSIYLFFSFVAML